MAPALSAGFDPLAGGGAPKKPVKSSKKAAKAEKAKGANGAAANKDGQKQMLSAMMDASQQEMYVSRLRVCAMLSLTELSPMKTPGCGLT